MIRGGIKTRDHYREELRQARAEIERLRTLLKEMFLLACGSNDIRNDCRQMREVGALLRGYEQTPEDRK